MLISLIGDSGHKGYDDEATDAGGNKRLRETQPSDVQGGVSDSHGRADAVVGILCGDRTVGLAFYPEDPLECIDIQMRFRQELPPGGRKRSVFGLWIVLRPRLSGLPQRNRRPSSPRTGAGPPRNWVTSHRVPREALTGIPTGLCDRL